MTTPPRLVLASASPARLRLLRAAGFDPEVLVSGVDETVPAATSTAATVVELARRKTRAVANRVGDALVVGADSLLDLDGSALGKPGSRAAAVARWGELAGRTATLCTGQCLIDAASGASAEVLTETRVTFGEPSPVEIAAYVDSGEPIEVAGAFTIDGLGAAFVERIDGDAAAVVGLSIAGLRRQLAELGLSVSSFWSY